MKLGTFGLSFKLLQSAPRPVADAAECAGIDVVPEIVKRQRRQMMRVTLSPFTTTTSNNNCFFKSYEGKSRNILIVSKMIGLGLLERPRRANEFRRRPHRQFGRRVLVIPTGSSSRADS
jgi:hypothetical protein